MTFGLQRRRCESPGRCLGTTAGERFQHSERGWRPGRAGRRCQRGTLGTFAFGAGGRDTPPAELSLSLSLSRVSQGGEGAGYLDHEGGMDRSELRVSKSSTPPPKEKYSVHECSKKKSEVEREAKSEAEGGRGPLAHFLPSTTRGRRKVRQREAKKKKKKKSEVEGGRGRGRGRGVLNQNF